MEVVALTLRRYITNDPFPSNFLSSFPHFPVHSFALVSRKVFSVISSKPDKNINPAPENINKRYFLSAGVEEIFRKFIHNPFGSLLSLAIATGTRNIFAAFPGVGFFKKTLLRSHTGWINFLLARKMNPENESSQTASHTCCARLNGIYLRCLIRIMMLFVYNKPKWLCDQ